MLVAQSCSTLCNPTECSSPGSSVHGIFQSRILVWVAIHFSKGSSWSMDWTLVSPIAGRFFTIWATGKAQYLIITEWMTSKYYGFTIICIVQYFLKLPTDFSVPLKLYFFLSLIPLDCNLGKKVSWFNIRYKWLGWF